MWSNITRISFSNEIKKHNEMDFIAQIVFKILPKFDPIEIWMIIIFSCDSDRVFSKNKNEISDIGKACRLEMNFLQFWTWASLIPYYKFLNSMKIGRKKTIIKKQKKNKSMIQINYGT